MKILKKIAAISAAASIAAGMISVTSYAEDMYKIHVDSDSASVGETVSVEVVIDTGSTGVGGISFMLNYDPQELELVSAKPGESLTGWITGDVDESGNNSLNLREPGKIGFAYITMGRGFSNKSAELIHASFNVLKPNAEISLTNISVSADDNDGTDISDQGSSEGTTVLCSHKNTEKKTTPATCKDDGKEETVCKDCNEVVETKTLPKTDDHEWGEWVTKDNVMCGETADQTRTCKVCGKTETKTGEKVEHDWNSGEVTKAPSCTGKGEKTFTCSRCNETKKEEIDALGHKVEEWETVKEAGCTEEGERKGVCVNCGEEFTETIAAKEHKWGDWEVTKEATKLEDGEETRICEMCGAEEKRAVEKLEPDISVGEVSTGIVPSAPSGYFVVPDITVSSSSASETVPADTASGGTTTAPVVIDKPVSEAATENAPANTASGTAEIGSASSDQNNAESTSQIGDSNQKTEDKNQSTGIALAVIPAALAAVGVFAFKKRK